MITIKEYQPGTFVGWVSADRQALAIRQAKAEQITLEMALAGGQAVAACLADPAFMAKPNYAGELAGRVYRAMREAWRRGATRAG